MTEVFFYHLQRQPIEAALPRLLERSLQRGWRALVRAASEQRLRSLDDRLWDYSDESFLPHGADGDGDPGEQPVLLTLAADNPNRANVFFALEGAGIPDDITSFERVAIMFDDADEEARAAARISWQRLKSAGHEVSYWQEDEAGRWRKRA